MWPFKKKEKLTFIPAQDIEQVYFNGYSKGLIKSKEAFTELGAHQELERIIKLLEDECCELEDCKCQAPISWLIAKIEGQPND